MTAAVVRDLAPTGVLRASINLGNPVPAHGTARSPGGVTVDIAREVGARLQVPVELVCFDAARASYEAMATGRAGPTSASWRSSRPARPRSRSPLRTC
ncbi:hypothetical protein [Actinacidiphila glaucinigra]|uniref:hypothetical protein n=1 Tax=Actinacidiphila glaucinigra TaxID=235986 RepID=UPI002E35C127|nr:hypothetical protein [Actinacidiphila glaucinigra]